MTLEPNHPRGSAFRHKWEEQMLKKETPKHQIAYRVPHIQKYGCISTCGYTDDILLHWSVLTATMHGNTQTQIWKNINRDELHPSNQFYPLHMTMVWWRKGKNIHMLTMCLIHCMCSIKAAVIFLDSKWWECLWEFYPKTSETPVLL